MKRTGISIVNALLLVVLLFGMTADTAWSQVTRRTKRAFAAAPSSASAQIDALGVRVQVLGKELTTLAGDYLDEVGQRRPVQILHQLPNLVVLRGFANRELKFDGRLASFGLPALDAALLETFGSDTPEGMLTALERGAAARLMGRGFKPDVPAVANYTGPSYDIYEVTAPALGADTPVRKKFYYFDSNSGLLVSTRYHDLNVTPAVRVEVRFSDWGRVDGSAYPGRIDRYENDRRVVSFISTATSAGPAVDVTNFR